MVVSVPVKFYRRNGRQMILTQEDSSKAVQQHSPPANTALIVNLAKAWHWQDQLESGEFSSVDEIARAGNVDRTHVSRILQLTSLKPAADIWIGPCAMNWLEADPANHWVQPFRQSNARGYLVDLVELDLTS